MMLPNLKSAVYGLVLALVISGCSHDIPLNPNLPESAGAPKIAETVGVYMSSDFKTHKHSDSQYGDTWVFPLGAASASLMPKAFEQAFAKTVPVDALPPSGDLPGDIAAVIEPQIQDFSFTLPFIKTGTYSSVIVYRFRMLGMEGTPFASWTVEGTGAKPGEIGFEFARWPGEAADLAMEDAAHKFIDGVAMVPEVRRWLQDRGAKISNFEPKEPIMVVYK